MLFRLGRTVADGTAATRERLHTRERGPAPEAAREPLTHVPHPALALNRLLSLFGTAPIHAHQSFERFIASGRRRCLAPWDDGAGILT